MKSYELYAFLRNNIKTDHPYEIEPAHFRPILEDMQHNDKQSYEAFIRLIETYKKNLAVRVMDERQTTLEMEF